MRTVATSVAVFLSLLALVGLYYAISGWLSLYDYGWGVMSAAGVVAALAMLLLLNIHSRTPWARRRAGSGPPKGTWVDAIPAAVLGCILAAVAGYLMTRAGIALGQRPESGDGAPYVISMRRELAGLWDHAHGWRDDAYLDDATIYMGEDNWRHLLLDAHFKSPSEDKESLLLYVYPDGSIRRRIVDWTTGVLQEDPIADLDWPLDSKAALEAFAENGEIGFCLRSTGPHSHRLTLERLWEGDDAPVVWTLLLDACPGAPSEIYHIDATTGEFLDPYVP